MKNYFKLIAKGIAMGTAEVVPGVSGGTIALLMGIYERLLNAIKSIDGEALRLLLKGKFKEFAQKIDLIFLICIGLGDALGIVLFAKAIQYALANAEVYVMSLFMGLILASVYLLWKTISEKNILIYSLVLFGVIIAGALSFVGIATENENALYLVACGAIAISCMILPGISGSFVLLLLGNYRLVWSSVTALKFSVLLPFGIGVLVGLASISRVLSFLYKRYREGTLALLTGFIAGSVSVIWPWKHSLTQTITEGAKTKIITVGYERYLPEFSLDLALCLICMIVGGIGILFLEKWAQEEH